MRRERQRLVAPLQRFGRLILCRQCLRDLPFTVSRGIRIGCELLHKIFVKLDPFAGIGFTADLLQSEVLRRARLDDHGCDLSRRQCDAKNTGQSAHQHPHIPSAEKRYKHPLMRASYIRFALESNIFARPRMAPGGVDFRSEISDCHPRFAKEQIGWESLRSLWRSYSDCLRGW